MVLLIGCSPKKTETPPKECLELSEVMTGEVSPAGVRTVFQLKSCDGKPVANLKNRQLEVLLDGEAMQSEGRTTSVLNQDVDFQAYALVLLDMSDSIVENGVLAPMLSAARTLIDNLLDDGVAVAVYRFAGPKYFTGLTPFVTDEDALNETLDDLEDHDGLGTTDLYGSISEAIAILDREGDPTVLSAKNLVVFTDGTDEARESTFEAARSAVETTSANVFTVGLGGDVNRDELDALGKNGFEWAADTRKLEAAFDRITKSLRALAESFYLIGVCSPRTRGNRELSLVVTRKDGFGTLTVSYDADGFDMVGCDAEYVADPCGDRSCGSVEGFYCGGCDSGVFCNEDGACETACRKNSCGVTHGVDCGHCEDSGETFICEENECIDACETVECGAKSGVDCGGCDAHGDGFGCVDGRCVDVCEDAECGRVDGVDCGSCAEPGFGCNTDHECVNACGDLQCGTVLGVSCGDCESGLVCSDAGRCEPSGLPGIHWSRVPGGDVTLGCDAAADDSCDFDAMRRTVTLSPFWMMTTEITVSMYEACVAEGGCDGSAPRIGGACTYALGDDLPINCISREALSELCAHMGAALPTEAQFERAMRGDHDGVTDASWSYPWGNTPAPSCDIVVMNEGGPGCGGGLPLPVGSRASNPYDLYDLAGNVAEWTRDLYAEQPGCASPCVDPVGPDEGDEAVVRGGAFDDLFATRFASSTRDSAAPDTQAPNIGGRCVKP